MIKDISVEMTKEDGELWEAIHDKSGWMSTSLHKGFLPVKLIVPFLREAGFKPEHTFVDIEEYIDELTSNKGTYKGMDTYPTQNE